MSKVQFIAEVSSNHNQDLDRCLEFIDVAAQIGCSGVKFQLFKVEELFTPEAIAYQIDQQGQSLDERRKWELPLSFLPAIAERCHNNGIEFLCTPFYLEAVKELEPYIDRYKVASYEMLWHDLVKACAETGKPVVLSTGMATLREVLRAVSVITETAFRDLTLLHCVSAYPTPRDQCNLRAIETLRDYVWPYVGWSDHSVDPAVIYRAAFWWDADMVEFHLDLDGDGPEFVYGHCWLPEQIAPVIAGVNAVSAMDGDGIKEPVESELPDRKWRADPSDGLRPLMSKREELARAARNASS
ncbi:MAG: N-acetylneuraminate synthase family protein [Planctomycetota bacterium]|jgi:N-acetylneuraminate synthase